MVPRGDGHPHPRPVWGLWRDGRLLLSVGSPTVAAQLRADPTVTVHLGSGTDVVLVEGRVVGATRDPAALDQYVGKYERPYDVDEHGPLTEVAPERVLAWRAAGRDGRDGFAAAGRWDLSR